MNGSNMRDKARAIFGKTFFENTKEPAPAKNAAVALQKRANARPIPTYKVGGVVKKQAGGALTAAEKARAEKMIRERGDAAMRDPLVMRLLEEQNRAPMGVPGTGPKAATKRAEGGGIEAQRLEARADAGRYKDGGNVQKKAAGGKSMRAMTAMPGYSPRTTIGDQAVGTPNSKLADRGIAKGVGPIMQKKLGYPEPVAMSRGMKKGGKAKDGLAAMPMKKASGGMAARLDRGKPVANAKNKQEIVLYPQRRKDGGKIAKKAIGGVMDQQDVMPSTLQQPAAAAPAYDSSGYGAGPKPMQKMVDNPNMPAPAYKKGGKIAKKAVGGTMAPAPNASKMTSAQRSAQNLAKNTAAQAAARAAAQAAGQASRERSAQRILAAKKQEVENRSAREAAQMKRAEVQQMKRAVLQNPRAQAPTAGGRPVIAPGTPRPASNPYSTDPVRPRAQTPTRMYNLGNLNAEGTATTNAITPGMNKGGKPVKRAVGGAGKTRKGMC